MTFFIRFLRNCHNLAASKLLTWIYFYCKGGTADLRASYADLESHVGLSRRNVRVGIKYLLSYQPIGQNCPVLEILEKGGGRRPTKYRINLEFME